MKGTIWWMMIVGVTVAVAFIAIPTALADNATTQEIVDEEHILDSTEESQLSAADDWFQMVENETVVSQSTAVEYDRGTDYTIDYENGTLLAVEGSDADNDDVYVTYYYDEIDETSEDISGLLALFEPIVALLFLMVVVGTLLAFTGWV